MEDQQAPDSKVQQQLKQDLAEIIKAADKDEQSVAKEAKQPVQEEEKAKDSSKEEKDQKESGQAKVQPNLKVDDDDIKKKVQSYFKK